MKIFTLFVFLTASFCITYAGSVNGSGSFFETNNIVIKAFQATTDGKYGKISWSFDDIQSDVTCWLQRSADGVNFTTIQSHEIQTGFSGGLNYVDKGAKTGINYYRLYIVKKAFIPHSSNIISIKINSNENPTKNYRIINPFTNQISISGDFTHSQKLQVEILDMRGRVKIVKQIHVVSQNGPITIDAGKISTGMYIVRIKDMGTPDAKPVMAKCVYKNID